MHLDLPPHVLLLPFQIFFSYRVFAAGGQAWYRIKTWPSSCIDFGLSIFGEAASSISNSNVLVHRTYAERILSNLVGSGSCTDLSSGLYMRLVSLRAIDGSSMGSEAGNCLDVRSSVFGFIVDLASRPWSVQRSIWSLIAFVNSEFRRSSTCYSSYLYVGFLIFVYLDFPGPLTSLETCWRCCCRQWMFYRFNKSAYC